MPVAILPVLQKRLAPLRVYDPRPRLMAALICDYLAACPGFDT